MIRTASSLFKLVAILYLLLNGCSSPKHIHSNVNKAVTGQSWQLPLASNTSINMIWIAPGSFVMGSPDSEIGRKTDEGPQTQVRLTKGYWLGKTEVTIGQWKTVMGESLREHVIKMLNDETVYDFGGQQKKLREFMNFNPNDPDRIMA